MGGNALVIVKNPLLEKMRANPVYGRTETGNGGKKKKECESPKNHAPANASVMPLPLLLNDGEFHGLREFFQ